MAIFFLQKNFILTNILGFKGVYLLGGIADLIAGTITGIVIFATFSKVIRKRTEEVAATNNVVNNEKREA